MEKYIGNGVIIYTDGGSYKSNPGPFGSGLHIVKFNNEENNKKLPISNLEISTKGYCLPDEIEKEEIQKDNKKVIVNTLFPNCNSKNDFIEVLLKNSKKYKVNVINFIDYCYSSPFAGTNSQAELTALKQALLYIIKNKPDCSIIYSDSEYSIKGFTNYLDKWISAKFINSTGKPVANKELWLELNELKQKLISERIAFTIRWLNGHKEYSGNKSSESSIENSFADRMASIGASISNNIINGFNDENEFFIEYTEEDLKEESKYKIHPLLINKRIYIPYNGRVDNKTYYLGNPGEDDDEHTGRPNPDAQIGIVHLEEPNEVIQMIEDKQVQWMKKHYGHYNNLFSISLDKVSNSKSYSLLSKYKDKFIACPKGVPNLETIDNIPLTTVFDPPFLFTNNIKELGILELTLNGIKERSNNLKIKDITDLLYDTKEYNVKESYFNYTGNLLLGKSLKKEINNNFKSFKVNMEFTNGNKDITLVLGIDLPKRNQLKGIDDKYPLVKLISWNNTGDMQNYAVLIVLHQLINNELISTGYGIWRGFNSNILII